MLSHWRVTPPHLPVTIIESNKKSVLESFTVHPPFSNKRGIEDTNKTSESDGGDEEDSVSSKHVAPLTGGLHRHILVVLNQEARMSFLQKAFLRRAWIQPVEAEPPRTKTVMEALTAYQRYIKNKGPPLCEIGYSPTMPIVKEPKKKISEEVLEN